MDWRMLWNCGMSNKIGLKAELAVALRVVKAQKAFVDLYFSTKMYP
jgi:hypothetical protein